MAILLPNGKQAFSGVLGLPLVGGRVYTYAAGTNTPQTTWADANKTVPNTNPVILDARGEASIFWEGAYKVVLRDALDNIVWTQDNVSTIDPLVAVFDAFKLELANATTPALLGFRQAGVGATLRTMLDKTRETYSITDFGASTAATAVQNLARIQAALDACPVGGTVIVPPGTYTVDTSGGLTAALLINKRIRLEMQGFLKASFTSGGVPAPMPIQTNPPFILNITADQVAITGNGGFIGDGTVNDLNAGTSETLPGLVRITGNGCSIRDIAIITPPKVGIMVYGAFTCEIANCQFTGGPVAYSDTAYFGIRFAAGGRHIITGNRFYPDATGGMFVQCMFAVNTNNCVITSNSAYRPYEKLVYWFGTGNVCSDNEIIGNSGTIPGTNTQGTITTVIRFHGSYNRILGNYAANVAGGVTVYDGQGTEVVGNSFIGCGAGGIAIIGNLSNLDWTRVEANTCIAGNLSGVIVGDGIYLATTVASPSKQVSVRGNTTNGFSILDPIAPLPTWQQLTAYPKISAIKPSVGNGRYYVPQTTGGVSGSTEPVWPTTPGLTVVDGSMTWVCVAYEAGVQSEIRILGTGAGNEITRSSITDNNLIGDQRGIRLEYVTESTAANNDVAVTLHHGREVNCSTIRWTLNEFRGSGGKSIVGMSTTSSFLTYTPLVTAAYAPPAINNNTGVTTTVAFPGAVLGDLVECAFSNNTEGLLITAWVSAADVISIRLQNGTGATIGLNPGTWRIRILKA